MCLIRNLEGSVCLIKKKNCAQGNAKSVTGYVVMVSFHDWHYIPNGVWVNAQLVKSIMECLYALM